MLECENAGCKNKAKKLFRSNNPRFKKYICNSCKMKEEKQDGKN